MLLVLLGGLAVGICEYYQKCEIEIVDLPHVIINTKEKTLSLKLEKRIQTTAIDIMCAPTYKQFDTAIMRSFLQVLSPNNVKKKFKTHT